MPRAELEQHRLIYQGRPTRCQFPHWLGCQHEGYLAISVNKGTYSFGFAYADDTWATHYDLSAADPELANALLKSVEKIQIEGFSAYQQKWEHNGCRDHCIQIFCSNGRAANLWPLQRDPSVPWPLRQHPLWVPEQ